MPILTELTDRAAAQQLSDAVEALTIVATPSGRAPNGMRLRSWWPDALSDSDLPHHARRFVQRLRQQTDDDRWALRHGPMGGWIVGTRESRAIAAGVLTTDDGQPTSIKTLCAGLRTWRNVWRLEPSLIVWAQLHHYRHADAMAILLQAQHDEQQRDAARVRTDSSHEAADLLYRQTRGHVAVTVPASVHAPFNHNQQTAAQTAASRSH